MIKTHPKSKIFIIISENLINFDDIILQVEHIPQPMCGMYYCFIEAVCKEDYENKNEQNLIELKEQFSAWLKTSTAFVEHYNKEIKNNEGNQSEFYKNVELKRCIEQYNKFSGYSDALTEVLKKIDDIKRPTPE
jgi:hypothetical protein